MGKGWGVNTFGIGATLCEYEGQFWDSEFFEGIESETPPSCLCIVSIGSMFLSHRAALRHKIHRTLYTVLMSFRELTHGFGFLDVELETKRLI